jgi:hypothetical protein
MADGLIEVDTVKLKGLSKSLGEAKTVFENLLKDTVPNITVTAGTFSSALALQSTVRTRQTNVNTLLTNISSGLGVLQAQLDVAIGKYEQEMVNDLTLITDLGATIDNAIGGFLPGLTGK